ncbi:MAG: radical SAM family heme chaperone HemW [Acidimicrobiia bacterium]|nr:radical SAM family heme chaperone HemW [Acidimicrobiia bacterium]
MPRPDAPEVADGAAGRVGAYVHVPFCRRVCPYCDFAVVAGAEDLADRYVDALVAEIGGADPFDRPLDAVFVGGGTPSRLTAAALGRVVDALAVRFGIASDAEVALEANPEDWSQGYAADLVAAGFTRVSLGAQSWEMGVLERLGRMHAPGDAAAAVADARAAGFESVNVDLIFGTPGETLRSWRDGVAAALDTGVDHLSTYALTVERGTPLSRAVAAGAPAPDPDLQAEMWEVGASLAAGAGLVRYETSNHARPGHAAVYNLLTWAQGDYAAFGTGAHGHRRGRRTRNMRRLDRYLEAVEGGGTAVQGVEEVTGWAAEQERLLLGLRRTAGVTAGAGGARLLGSPEGRRLVEAGVLEAVGGRLRVARPLLGDEVARAVLALDPREC